VWGLDVMRGGRDYNALVRRNSMCVLPEMEMWQSDDTMKVVGKVKTMYEALPESERPELILVDVIGIGAGVVDRGREVKLPVRGINVSESAALDEQYANLRAELWFRAKDWLAGKDKVLPACPGGCQRDCLHERLAAELVAPKLDYTSNGRLQVEGKKEMRKRGVASPNLADAFCLTFAVDASVLQASSSERRNWHGGTSWNEPVRRKLVHV
jgi:phage terminase large subunit